MFKAFDTFWYVIDVLLETVVEMVGTVSKIIKSFLRGIQAIAEEFEKETTKGVKKQHRPKKRKAA